MREKPSLTAAFGSIVRGRPLPGDLERRLEARVAAGARAWPGVTVDAAGYVQHLAARVGASGDVGPALDALSDDLYLAYACTRGEPRALAAFEGVLARATAYVTRAGDAAAEELRQTMRTRLLTADGRAEPLIARYGGRAPLAAWLRVVAVRVARSLLRSSPNEETLRTGAGAARGGDPETQLLKARHASAFNRAIEAALARLSTKDRALVRLYFVESMSLKALARVYHVHESTMSRRLAALRAEIAEHVRAELRLAPGELESIAAFVMSRVDVHLSKLGR